MINYQQIDALYGAPLNVLAKPQTPFKLNAWHILGAVVLGYVLYKGITQIRREINLSLAYSDEDK